MMEMRELMKRNMNIDWLDLGMTYSGFVYQTICNGQFNLFLDAIERQ